MKLGLACREETIDDSQVYKQQMSAMGGGAQMMDVNKAFAGEKQALELVRLLPALISQHPWPQALNMASLCIPNLPCPLLATDVVALHSYMLLLLIDAGSWADKWDRLCWLTWVVFGL